MALGRTAALLPDSLISTFRFLYNEIVGLLAWLSIPEPKCRLVVCEVSDYVQVLMGTVNPTEMVGSCGLLFLGVLQ
jgi:hypothetical protein